MLTGPQNMPKFSDRQLSPEEKHDIVAYVRDGGRDADAQAATASAVSAPRPRAGAWIVGIVAIIGAALWIGARA